MNDIEDMNREQLIGQIMHLRKRVDQLETQVIGMGWRLDRDRIEEQFSGSKLNRRGDKFS